MKLNSNIKIVVAGAVNIDINLFVDKHPRIGEEVPVHRITRIPGGKGANIAVAAARITGGGRVALLASLGMDSIGDMQIQVLREEGVSTEAVKRIRDVESGQAYIVIDRDGRNVIHTHFGANKMLSASDIRSPKVQSIIENCKVAVIVDPPLDALTEAIKIAWRAERTVIWHPGVRSTLGIERLRETLARIDYLVLNKPELENIASTPSIYDAYRKLRLINREISLIVTLGEEGCTLINQKKQFKLEGINLKKYGLKAVNTVGCGDAFLGVFAAYKAEGYGDEEALRMANAAGAFKATRFETRGSPTKSELEAFLKRIEGET